MKILEQSEKSQLETFLKETRDLSEWKRIFAIIGYDEGQSVEELSLLLRLSTYTIEQYLRDYHSNKKTKNGPRGGSQSKLLPEESDKLEQHLTQKTYLKIKDIIAYVRDEFGKEYSRSGMTAWLRSKGFVFKKPKKIPGKLNPESQQQFACKYRELKENCGEDEEIYFMDAVHPDYQSQVVCGWIKKGECKTLQTTGKQSRLHFAGALNLENMNLFIEEYDSVNKEAIIDFFTGLEKRSKASVIHVILDNARAQKNKALDKFLKDSKIKLHYLPPYSPNLNAIERLWKVLRENTSYNRYYASCNEFFESVYAFFRDKVPKMKNELKQRINDNFQFINPNPISLN